MTSREEADPGSIPLGVDILERVTDGIVAFDTHMNYTYINHRGAEMLGRTPGELLGKNYWSEFPDAAETPFAQAYMTALKQQTPLVLEDYYEPWQRWFENRIYPSRNGLTVFFTEITERRRLDEAVKSNEQLLRNILDTVPSGIAVVDPSGKITRANTEAERVLGLSESTITGRTYDDVGWKIAAVDGGSFPPDDIPVAQVLRTKAPVSGIEHAIEHPDGRRTILSVNAAPMRDASGTIVSVVTSFTDITARKKAEMDLRVERDFIDAVLDSLPGVFYCYDENFRFVRWNKDFERISGYSKAEVGGMSPLDFFRGDDREHVRSRIMEVFERGESNAEARFVSKDGSSRSYYFTGTLAVLAGRRHLVGTGIDISERKLAEAALRESEEFWRTIIETAPDAIFLMDETYNVLQSNVAAEKIYGYGRGELLTKSLYDLRSPETRDEIVTQMQEALVRNGARWETTHCRKDGSAFPVEVSTKPFVVAGRLRFIHLVREITERKRAEEELSRSRERLRALNNHLQTVIEEERARIAREIHDDVGQMMTAIKMDLSLSLQTLESVKEKKIRTDLEGEVRALIGLLDQGVQSIRKIIRDLRPEVLETMGLIAGIRWQAQEFEKRSKVKMVLSLPTEELLLDKPTSVALFRIVQEALTNVARHAHAKTVELALDLTESGILVRIADDGRGISDVALAKSHSFGLLAMRERVAALGGTLSIRRKQQRGTAVEVLLPPTRDATQH